MQCYFHGHTHAIWAIGFLNATNNIISGSADQTIKIWSLQEFAFISLLTGHKGSVNDLKFQINNPKYLASASSDQTVRIWDVVSQKSISTNLIGNNDVLSIAYMNNGDLVSSSGDKTIKIWSSDLFYNISITYYSDASTGNN